MNELLFRNNSINPRYSILSKALKRSEYSFPFEKAYYIGGFEYKEESYLATLKTLKKDLSSELARLKYNAQVDNVEIYLIESGISTKYLIFVYDPVELYQFEKILDIHQIEGNELLLNNPEQIFP